MKKGVIRYTLIQVIVWAIVGGICSFASRYLLGVGLSNTQAGLVLGVSTALSVLFQPVITGLVEGRRVSLRGALVALSLMLAASLAAVPHLSRLTAVVLVFGLANVVMGVMPCFVTALAMVSRREGIAINFGITRGLGSLSFGVAARAMNLCVEHWGLQSIPWLGVALAAALSVLLMAYPPVSGVEKQEKPTGLWEFLRDDKKFTAFLLGNILLYVGHNALGNCMFQVAAYKGDADAQGMALMIAAVVEIPAMFLFSRMMRWHGSGTWVRFSAVFMVLRIFLSLVLPGVTGLYVAQVVQALGYAILAVATVQYADQVVAAKDVVKAQAYLGATCTIGSLVSNFCAGAVIDALGVPVLLTVATTLAAAGAAVMMFAVKRTERLAQ